MTGLGWTCRGTCSNDEPSYELFIIPEKREDEEFAEVILHLKLDASAIKIAAVNNDKRGNLIIRKVATEIGTMYSCLELPSVP